MIKKPADADIRNLFRRFGGDAGNYQEIQQEYVDDKAAQSWPIVEAMEKERAKAPTLRASAALQGIAHASPVVKPAAAPPVVTRQTPVAEAVRPVKQAGSISTLFSKPAPAPASIPARSLFAALSSPANSMSSQEKSGSLPASNQTVQVRHSENDTLHSVFSRLTKPQNPVNPRSQENGLRSMLGFLKKQ